MEAQTWLRARPTQAEPVKKLGHKAETGFQEPILDISKRIKDIDGISMYFVSLDIDFLKDSKRTKNFIFEPFQLPYIFVG